LNRTALVTGGARRIGRAVVERLALDGYAVAVHCNRSRGEADTLASALVGRGHRATVIVGDLAEADTPARLVAEAAAALGSLTLLVNNASLFEPDYAGSLDVALWQRQFDVNLRAPVLLAEAFARQVPPAVDASIVNMLDQKVFKLNPLFFSYTLSKTGLHTATILLAQALAPGVRVNAVAPGPSAPSVHGGEDGLAREIAGSVLRRGSPPEAIADAVAYLARATSVTGQTIAVDGGQHLAWQTPDLTGWTPD
jgi:NAD(P)-dependent dehydrogenase (short-subunit alcohol dehydrogenase family)